MLRLTTTIVFTACQIYHVKVVSRKELKRLYLTLEHWSCSQKNSEVFEITFDNDQ